MKEILTVGFHKGEMDFGVNTSIGELSLKEMQDFRTMVCVAIGQAEQKNLKALPRLLFS